MIYWQTWALLTPLIFRFARRYKIERGKWLHGLPPLILFGLVVALLHISLGYAIDLSLGKNIVRGRHA